MECSNRFKFILLTFKVHFANQTDASIVISAQKVLVIVAA